MKIISKSNQAHGAFNGGQIIENKPIGFNREGGLVKAHSTLFYWANAIAKQDSTIGLHPHQGFEIMSFVLEGNIRHFDTKQNNWISLSKGDVQIIRAGNGISHAEHMEKGSRMFQIWVDPDLSQTMSQEASYNDYKNGSFPVTSHGKTTITHYSGEKGIMKMDTNETIIEKWDISDSTALSLNPDQKAAIYVLNGSLIMNNKKLEKDDFILLEDSDTQEITGTGSIFLIKYPVKPAYKTYQELMQARML